MNITHIVAVLTRCTKDFAFYTDLPSGVYPYDGEAFFKMNISCDWKEYLEKHFPNIPVQIIDVRDK
jgi:hypothetical protein